MFSWCIESAGTPPHGYTPPHSHTCHIAISLQIATPLHIATPSPDALSPFISSHACYCPNTLLSKFPSLSLSWKLEVLSGLGDALISANFPVTRRDSCFATLNTAEMTWGLTAGHPMGHIIFLTIPTPSKVKMAVPKNSKKVFQLATSGRLL